MTSRPGQARGVDDVVARRWRAPREDLIYAKICKEPVARGRFLSHVRKAAPPRR